MEDFREGYGTFGGSEKGSLPIWPGQSKQPSKIHPHNWMSHLDDETPLSAITIPGTHDSAAYTVSFPFVTTQRMSIVQQLDAGIRYFDFRCSVRDNVVQMVHGPTPLGLKLEEVLDGMYKWLAKHPREALIIQIKRDQKNKKSSMDFATAVSHVLAKRSELWRTANTTPSIGDLRGRIQLFRRFVGCSLYAYGIDVSPWQDNPSEPFTICTLSGVQITIQDHYAFPDPEPLPSVIAKKGGDVAGLLKRADNDADSEHWYLNFTSAFELNIFYQLPPRSIAVGGWWFFRWKHGLNVRLRQSLREAEGRRRRFGIVSMDFPEQGADDLVASLFMSNFNTRTAQNWRIRIVSLLLLWVLVTLLWSQYGSRNMN